MFAVKHPKLPVTRQLLADESAGGKQAQAMQIPQSVTVRYLPLPKTLMPQQSPHGQFSYDELSNEFKSLRRLRESSPFWRELAQPTAVIEVSNGPQAGYVAAQQWVDFLVRKDGRVFNLRDVPNEFVSGAEQMVVSCVDSDSRLQSRVGPFVRTRVHQYLQNLPSDQNQQLGKQVSIKMVGVGYRAAVEQMDLSSKNMSDIRLLERFVMRQSHLIKTDPLRSHLAV